MRLLLNPPPFLRPQPVSELVDGDGSILHVNDKKLVSGGSAAAFVCCFCRMYMSTQWHSATPALPGMNGPHVRAVVAQTISAAMKIRLKFSGTNGMES